MTSVISLHDGLADERRVVVLNGPAGVGKTTTARALAATARNGAAIHGDSLRDFMITRRSADVRQGLGYRNGASVASNFIKAGYELVVFEYVFETPAGIDSFCEAYDADAPVHFFTLWAPLDVVVARARERQRHPGLGNRVEACYRAVASSLGQLGPVVDTSEQSPPDVVADLLARCACGEGQLIPGVPDRPLALVV